MKEQTLKVQIEAANDGDVRLDDFLKFLAELQRTLNATDRAVSHSDEPTAFYNVRDLSHSSPTTVVLAPQVREPDLDMRDVVLSTFVETVNTILSGNAPRRLSSALLLHYRDLAAHFDGRLKEANFQYGAVSARVSSAFQERLTQVLGPDRQEHGTASGTVEIVNVHQSRLFFWLYPVGGPTRIQCYFPKSMTELVGSALTKHVTVSGVLVFKATMFQPYQVNVRDVDVHEPDEELPSIRDLRGIAPAAPGAEMSEDLVQRLRDDW